MRVAYVVQNVGGVDLTKEVGDSIPVKYTLQGLRKSGHGVSFLSLAGRSVIGIDDPADLNDRWHVPTGISDTLPFKVFESAVRRVQRTLRQPYFAFFDSYRFYEACVRALPTYDLCHEHNGLFCLGAPLACRRKDIPYVLTFSADPLSEYELLGNPLQGVHAAVARWAARLAYGTARKIICVSEPAKRHLIDTWQVEPEKICVMPNGVDTAVFGRPSDTKAVRAQLGIDGAPVVMFAGWFQLWHGLDRLVESFVQVLRKIPEARLVLVGDGPARSLVERKGAELGIAESVLITGLVPHSQVPGFLAAADVATLPYPALPKEMWFSPLKLYEYMAAGKAIVASNAGQISEVIENGRNGLLVQSGDVDALAEALVDLLKAPAERERLGQNARQQAIAQHSWERYIERLEEIYLSVL